MWLPLSTPKRLQIVFLIQEMSETTSKFKDEAQRRQKEMEAERARCLEELPVPIMCDGSS